MAHKKYTNLILVLLATLSSCSGSVKSDFTCKVLEGGKGSCISIKEADSNLSNSSNRDSNPNLTYLTSAPKIQINLIAPKFKDLQKLQIKESSLKEERSKPSSLKLRSDEKIGRIWFAPYIDSEGNRHSQSEVYVVDEEARWLAGNNFSHSSTDHTSSNSKEVIDD